MFHIMEKRAKPTKIAEVNEKKVERAMLYGLYCRNILLFESIFIRAKREQRLRTRKGDCWVCSIPLNPISTLSKGDYTYNSRYLLSILDPIWHRFSGIS